MYCRGSWEKRQDSPGCSWGFAARDRISWVPVSCMSHKDINQISPEMSGVHCFMYLYKDIYIYIYIYVSHYSWGLSRASAEFMSQDSCHTTSASHQITNAHAICKFMQRCSKPRIDTPLRRIWWTLRELASWCGGIPKTKQMQLCKAVRETQGQRPISSLKYEVGPWPQIATLATHILRGVLCGSSADCSSWLRAFWPVRLGVTSWLAARLPGGLAGEMNRNLQQGSSADHLRIFCGAAKSRFSALLETP